MDVPIVPLWMCQQKQTNKGWLKYPFEKEHACEKGLQKKSDWTLEKPTVTRIHWKKEQQ